jgi:glycosyltransferase involved in cell wall biosynthesis
VRILHVVPTYLPATRYGGPIYSVHGLCRALVRRGHQVDVFTTNVDGERDSDVPLGTPVDLDGVSVRYFATNFRRLYVSPSMRRMLADSIGRYDLAHLHSVFLWPAYAAARTARRHDVPYVISPRGMLVQELIARKSHFAKLLWIRAVERRTFSHAAAVHFTTQTEWDDARRLPIPLPSPFVVPNGIDLLPLDARRRLDNTILFLGRVNWKKGLDHLIDAMALVPEATLIVAGNDEEGLTPRLRAQAERNGTAARIDFRGAVAGTAKDDLLLTSAILVLPSYSENFGNVVLEAMAASTPVIVTPEVGLAHDVAEADAGIVSSNEPEHLAAAIRALLNDADRRDTLGRHGRALVVEHFTWDAIAARMEHAYENVTAAARGRRG